MLPIELCENLVHIVWGDLLVFLIVVENLLYVGHLWENHYHLIHALKVYRSVHIESLARSRFDIFRWCWWFTLWVLGSCSTFLAVAVGSLPRHSAWRIVSSQNLAGRGKTTQIINNCDDTFNHSYALSRFDSSRIELSIHHHIFQHLIQSRRNLIFEYLAYPRKVNKQRFCLVQCKA